MSIGFNPLKQGGKIFFRRGLAKIPKKSFFIKVPWHKLPIDSKYPEISLEEVYKSSKFPLLKLEDISSWTKLLGIMEKMRTSPFMNSAKFADLPESFQLLRFIQASNDENIKLDLDLRKIVFYLSAGSMLSAEAFTKNELPIDEKEMLSFIMDQTQYLPEIQTMHKNILNEYEADIEKLGQKIDMGFMKSVLVCGGSGSGKTTGLQTVFELDDNDMNGVINPDNIKSKLENELLTDSNGIFLGNSALVHLQGSALSKILSQDVLEKTFPGLIVEDRTFADLEYLKETAKMHQERERAIHLMNFITTPLQAAAVVLNRPVNGTSPRVPSSALANKYIQSIKNYKGLIDYAKTEQNIVQCEFFAYGDQIGSKDSEGFKLESDISTKIISQDPELEIKEVFKTKIDDNNLESLASFHGQNYDFYEQNLEMFQQHLGKTIEQALNDHSSKIEIYEPQEKEEGK